MGGFGKGAAASGGTVVGVADGAGQTGADLAGVAEAGGEGEQGAPVLGRVEFVAFEAVLSADARRCGGEADDRGVPAEGMLVEGAAGPGRRGGAAG